MRGGAAPQQIRDLDSAGLLTPAIEQALPPFLRPRLQEIRATE
jgi:hypothetical protein